MVGNQGRFPRRGGNSEDRVRAAVGEAGTEEKGDLGQLAI